MKEWGIIIAVVVVVILTSQAVYQVGRLIGLRLDELEEKIDSLQEKLEEIKAKQDESTSTYVNPIDL
jgi:Sec-independent protein translocase protein TatA